jgi:hypothetical protein
MGLGTFAETALVHEASWPASPLGAWVSGQTSPGEPRVFDAL